jgi:pimeloyl-ACP methyl ester carboxylesterase
MHTLPVLHRPRWLPATAWPWPTYRLPQRTGRIAVTDIGEGPTLLFVHVGTWSFVWRDVLMRLQSDFRCVTLDAPGNGQSARSDPPPTMANAGESVTAVIDALDLRDITLIAHDLGGPAGFLAASRRAERIAALMAVNCFAWKPTGAFFRGMLAAMGSAPANQLDAFAGWMPRLAASSYGAGRHWDRADRAIFRAGIDRPARRAWHAYMRSAGHADALYTEIDTGLCGALADRPLTTIFGQFNDPLRLQRRWKALYPNAQQLVVRHGNHFPMCDDPDFVASAVKARVRAG